MMDKLHEFQKFAPQGKLLRNSRNAIIYTRVSTKEQADTNTSLETQKKYCENYAVKNGYNVVAYFGGTHESAKSDDRKEFKRMLKFAKQSGAIGCIIVYSYDRFSRTGSNAAQITHELMNVGIQVKAVTQEVDSTTPSGKFQQNLFYMFSQFDNELRRDKTITAMTDLLRKGYWLWAPPRGYINRNRHHKVVDGRIEISQEGNLLKKAFKWRLEGKYSNTEIVRRLNLEGMRINDKRLHEIFKNPFYCGILVSKMLPGEVNEGRHRPIVSREDFLRINNERDTSPQEHKSDNDQLPLKQFVYCGECNTPLTGYIVRQKGLYYYKCRTKGCSCSKSAKQLHEQFIHELGAFQVDTKFNDVIKEVMIYSYDSVTHELRSKEASINRMLAELNKKIEAIEERFALGQIDAAIYQKFRARFEKEKQNLEAGMSNSTISSSNLQKAIDKALNLASNLSEIWVSGDLMQKKKIQNLVFPAGIGYHKQKGVVLTTRVNSIFSSISTLTHDLGKRKSGEPININQFSASVTPEGF